MIAILLRLLVEAAVVVVLCFIVLVALAKSSTNGETTAGAAVRMVASLVLPALGLAFLHFFWWPLSLAISLVVGLLQYDGEAMQAVVRRLRTLIVEASAGAKVAVGLVCVSALFRAAVCVASTPYNSDSVMYHLPMSIEFLQRHTAVPAQLMFHPGNAELLDALGLGGIAAVGGHTLTEGIAALALVFSTFGLVRRSGGSVDLALLCACAVCAMPLVSDQLFTAQNDILTTALLLAFVTLWGYRPRLCGVSLGLVAGTKFTGLAVALALIPLMRLASGPGLGPIDLAVALAIGAPWYVRNAVEVHQPLFLGALTHGVSSTIAAHLRSALPFVGLAFWNYGGLPMIAGFFCMFSPAVRKAPVPLRALPWMVVIGIFLWSVMPDSAESIPGTLDQVMLGWSIRYIMVVAVFLTVAAIVWLHAVNAQAARLAVVIIALSIFARAWVQTYMLDSDALRFAWPLACVVILTLSAVLARRRLQVTVGVAAVALFAVITWFGSARISAIWDMRYAALTPGRPTGVLNSSFLRNAHTVATIQARPLPFMGAHFERYAVSDLGGLSTEAWWRNLGSEAIDVVIATDGAERPGDPRWQVISADEQVLRASHRFRQVYQDPSVRAYLPEPTPTPTPAPMQFAHLTVHAPNATLSLEVADTQAKAERGLMYRTALAAHTGMIFLFRSDEPVEFWMKNTFVPLDMVFVSANGRVRSVAKNVPASTPQTPEAAVARVSGVAKYVLELPAGEASVDGLRPGAAIPELPQRS